jgi:hypothetical protein
MTIYITKNVNGVDVPLTQSEIDELNARDVAAADAAAAAAPEKARVAAVDAAIAVDATIAQLKAMSNADFDTWWAANVTTLAQANNVLKRIARVVLRRVV